MSEQNKHNFQIGQIIYLLSEKAEAIVPAIIVEEMTVKKLDGHKTSWKVAVGPPNKRREIDSNNLKGELHTSLEEIREVMTQRLTDFVGELVDSAKKKTEAWYGQHIVEQAKEDGSGGKIDPAALLSSIDGTQDDMFLPKQNAKQNQGQQAQNPADPNSQQSYKVKAPPVNGPLKKGPHLNVDPNDPKSAMRQQLLELATPSEEELAETASNEQEYIVTDDGRKVPVKYNIKEQ